MLMGETSRLPVYQTVYSGSLKDVSTLKSTLSKLDHITCDKPVLVVMDKGFCSKNNVDDMLCDEKIKKFLIAVPFSLSFAQKQVSEDIDDVENNIVVGSDSIRGVTRLQAWDNEHKIFTHVYYNALKALRKREELYAHVTTLRNQAEAEPEKCVNNVDYTKYLNICKAEKSESGYTISIRKNVLDSALKTAGWVVIISNDIDNAKRALQIYRAKDVVEKGFLRLKRNLDLGRLRVHSQNNMQNKVFIGFVALVILSKIHSVMADQELYKKMTMQQLLRILSKQRVQEIDGTRIVFPTTKQQKLIYKAFTIKPPM
jgi:transposase